MLSVNEENPFQEHLSVPETSLAEKKIQESVSGYRIKGCPDEENIK